MKNRMIYNGLRLPCRPFATFTLHAGHNGLLDGVGASDSSWVGEEDDIQWQEIETPPLISSFARLLSVSPPKGKKKERKKGRIQLVGVGGCNWIWIICTDWGISRLNKQKKIVKKIFSFFSPPQIYSIHRHLSSSSSSSFKAVDIMSLSPLKLNFASENWIR